MSRIIISLPKYYEKEKKIITVHPSMTIRKLLDKYPQTACVFNRRKMACVGCPAEDFGSLKEVARSYNINLPELLNELAAIIAEKYY